MFRPEIKVIDCTVRDGGLMNNSHFTLPDVRAIYKAVCEAGVDIVELGYKNSKKHFSPSEFGAWRFCEEDMLIQAIEGIDNHGTKLAVMMDSHKASPDDIRPKSESVIDMIRVATYVKDIDKAITMANAANDLGYDTAINIMAISHTLDRELDEALMQIEDETRVLSCYIVDSFGALYSEDIDYYVAKYQKFLKTKEVGIHCHNHQQLAFANTIEAIIKNANYLDGTLYGLGRAAGNCPLELMLSFLKNPKFNLKPVLEVIGKTILPMRADMEWGYTMPYMIAGILNVHPSDAMDIMMLPKDDPRRMDFVKFYEDLSLEAQG